MNRVLNKNLYWALTVSLCSLGVVTNTSAEEQHLIRPQVASLVSSPGRCELKSGNNICEMSMNLIWEAPTVDAYCVWLEKQSQPIKCWDQAWQGSVQIDFKGSKKTGYVLRVKNTETTLAATNVSVTGSYKQRKRAQRRKRGFWRMF